MFRKTFIFLGVITMLCGCTSHKLNKYENDKPEIIFEEFFDGKLKGWGIVQDWRGQVVRRFDVKMDGSWDGNNGVIDEIFEYYDGETQKRIWKVVKNNDGTYQGTAGDIIGGADGSVSGNTINWAYQMDLPVNGKTYRVKFDDWMWLMNDDVLVNRSYIKKFGITVAELTLFIQKVPEK